LKSGESQKSAAAAKELRDFSQVVDRFAAATKIPTLSKKLDEGGDARRDRGVSIFASYLRSPSLSG
jgi:hypothetical protein